MKVYSCYKNIIIDKSKEFKQKGEENINEYQYDFFDYNNCPI